MVMRPNWRIACCSSSWLSGKPSAASLALIKGGIDRHEARRSNAAQPGRPRGRQRVCGHEGRPGCAAFERRASCRSIPPLDQRQRGRRGFSRQPRGGAARYAPVWAHHHRTAAPQRTHNVRTAVPGSPGYRLFKAIGGQDLLPLKPAVSSFRPKLRRARVHGSRRSCFRPSGYASLASAPRRLATCARSAGRPRYLR